MENFILPKNVLGTVKVTPKGWRDEFYIGEASLAVEQIGNYRMLNVWINSYHYELHSDKEVLIGDVGLEIMQPIKEELLKGETINIGFPNDLSLVQNNWEELYYGHFYQFEHLKIAKWKITMKSIGDEELTKINVKGHITDDIRKTPENYNVECTFKTKMEFKIDSRWNWNFSSNNPNAYNKK